MSDEFRIAAVSYRALHLKYCALENNLAAAQAEIAELTEEKSDYIEIIKELRKKCDAVAKADYERGFDDGFILRKEKDGVGGVR